MSFNDMVEVHELQMKTDNRVLQIFWNPKNDDMKLGDLKEALIELYLQEDCLFALDDCKKRHSK